MNEKLIKQLLIALLAGILLFIGIIAFSAAGYKNGVKPDNQRDSLSELESKILVYEANLSYCDAFNKEFMAELEKYSNKLSDCKAELNALKVFFNISSLKYDSDIKKLEEELERKDAEMRKIEDKNTEQIININQQYKILAHNSANNICCKMRVDNSKISYYKIENGRIVCLEEGINGIVC